MKKIKLPLTPVKCENCEKELNSTKDCTFVLITYTLEQYNTDCSNSKTENLIKYPTLIKIGAPLCKKCLKNEKKRIKAIHPKFINTKKFDKIIQQNIEQIIKQNKN
jgi:hypothetical protein